MCGKTRRFIICASLIGAGLACAAILLVTAGIDDSNADRGARPETRQPVFIYDANDDSADPLPPWNFGEMLDALRHCIHPRIVYDIKVLAWSEGTLQVPEHDLTYKICSATVYFRTGAMDGPHGVAMLRYFPEPRHVWEGWDAGRHECPYVYLSQSEIFPEDVYALWKTPTQHPFAESNPDRPVTRKLRTRLAVIRENTWKEVFGSLPSESYTVP